MEKKYYFRGLGLGIIVTAVIMGIALSGGGKTSEMTDDEVIARARELGMTEDTRLLEPSVEEEKEPDGANINTGEAEQPVKKDVAVKAGAGGAARGEEGEGRRKEREERKGREEGEGREEGKGGREGSEEGRSRGRRGTEGG